MGSDRSGCPGRPGSPHADLRLTDGARVNSPSVDCASLQLEIDELRREVRRLRASNNGPPSDDGDVYASDDDDEEARAFDDFYRAYDEIHDKTRKFLLG